MTGKGEWVSLWAEIWWQKFIKLNQAKLSPKPLSNPTLTSTPIRKLVIVTKGQ